MNRNRKKYKGKEKQIPRYGTRYLTSLVAIITIMIATMSKNVRYFNSGAA